MGMTYLRPFYIRARGPKTFLSFALAVQFLILSFPAVSADSSYPDAPPIPAALDWLNVSESLTLEHFRGRATILDFWTYGCINCLHVADELKRLEEKYGEKILVIGVHSPKFENEKNLETLKKNILRYDRRHPVVNDTEMVLMRIYRIRAWPTLVLIDPEGKVRGKAEGESGVEALDLYLEEMLPEFNNIKAELPIPLRLEKTGMSPSLLFGPGKITVSSGKVAISDTLHHRIILADEKGRISSIFGGPEPGNRDGITNEARFSSPQGMIFHDHYLFVADTGNHLIRQIDLKTNRVSTIAGTGRLSEHILRGPQSGRESDLRSPWDLAVHGKYLYIAMAGSHQIMRLDLTDGELAPFSGSGFEGLDEGDWFEASFSQPSGLSIIGNYLYVADAEASAIRRVSLDDGEVKTIVGTGLFDFGDKDGKLESAQLQHALGVAALDTDRLLVADTYNHKLKLLNLAENELETVLGNGSPGIESAEGMPVLLNEPGGIAMLGKRALVTDTNNNRVIFYDTGTGESGEWALLPPATQ